MHNITFNFYIYTLRIIFSISIIFLTTPDHSASLAHHLREEVPAHSSAPAVLDQAADHFFSFFKRGSPVHDPQLVRGPWLTWWRYNPVPFLKTLYLSYILFRNTIFFQKNLRFFFAF